MFAQQTKTEIKHMDETQNNLLRSSNIMFKLFASKKREQNAVSKKIQKMIQTKTLPAGLDEYF